MQDKVYDEPTALLAANVSGQEEIPEGVVAVITPDAPDMLSHSSVRVRNMKVSLDFDYVLVLRKALSRCSLCNMNSRHCLFALGVWIELMARPHAES